MRWWLLLFVASAQAYLIAYPTDQTYSGLLGDRTKTSSTCFDVGQTRFGCTASTSFLYFFGSAAIQDAFDPNEQVRTATGDIVGTAATLDLSFFPDVWIGNASDVQSTCGEWESESICSNGLVHTTNGKLRPKKCATKHRLLCLCAGGATSETNAPVTLGPTVEPTTRRPTTAPTPYPTRSPTKAPTSDSPSAGPSESPSGSPSAAPTTLSPTNIPTSQPTTLAPTSEPTVAPTLGEPIYMFRVGSDSQLYQGDFATTLTPTINGGCGAVVPPTCSPTYRFLRSDAWSTFNSVFDTPGRPVYALTWLGATYLLTNDQSTLPWSGTPYLGGLCPSNGTSFWYNTGCTGFTSSSSLQQGNTQFCDLSSTDLDTCNTNNPVLCYCGSRSTFSPTPSPTKLPTTRSPTQSPVLVSNLASIFYRSAISSMGDTGLVGLDSNCASSATSYGFTCAKGAVAFIGAPTRNATVFPSLFGFSESQTVYARLSSGNVVPFNSNWNNFLFNHFEFGLSVEDIESSVSRFGGFTTTGAYNPSLSCSGWTSNAGSYRNVAGFTFPATPLVSTWLGGEDTIPCGSGGWVMCMCMGALDYTQGPSTLRPTTLAPSRTPTTQPTPNPSASPSASPTSAPTGEPIVLFSDNLLRGGNLGNRETTSGTCASIAAAQSLTCPTPRMLLSYVGDSIADFPITYQFAPNSPVKSVSGLTYAGSWAGLATPTYTLQVAGTLAPGPTSWWSGDEIASLNCNNWTSASSGDNAIVGVSSLPGYLYNNGAGAACNALLPIVCACLPALPTSAPTTLAPTPPTTLSPSLQPTTLSPTAPTTATPTTLQPTNQPTRVPGIVIFRYAATNGNLGNRATTTTQCDLIPNSFICVNRIMLLSYTGDTIANMDTTYGFSPSLVVYGPTGTEIASSWTNFIAGTQTNTIAGASVGTTQGRTWTGNTIGDNTCNQWTHSASGTFFGGYGDNAGSLFSAPGNDFCNSIADALCMCIEGSTLQPTTQSPTNAPTTLSPTPPTTLSPTLDPTIAPTQQPTTLAPTVQPTIAPTAQPTLLPTRAPTLAPTSAPTFTPAILLFSQNAGITASPTTMGLRSDSTARCTSIINGFGKTCSIYRALLSYSGDTIQALHVNHGFSASLAVLGPSRTVIASSWTNFVAGSFSTSLQSAGVSSASIWTGGLTSGNNCDEWRTGTSGFSGTYGASSTAGLTTFNTGSTYTCDLPFAVLVCVCVE